MIQKLTFTILITIMGCSLAVISFSDHPLQEGQRTMFNQPRPTNSGKHSGTYQRQHGSEQKVERINRLLPQDAAIAFFDPDGNGKPEEAILTAHLKNNFQQQIVVLYRESMAESGESLQSVRPLTLAVFSGHQEQLHKEWETDLAGPQIWTQEAKDIGLQVVDVNADGKDEIMAITGIGASVGGYLQIFAWDGTSYQPINPSIQGHYFRFGRDGRGRVRIRAKSRYEEAFHIYEWDGRRYREVNTESHHNQEAQFYEDILLGSKPITPYLFGDYLQRAVWSDRRNGEIENAMDLCERALQVIVIPGKLIPVMPSDEASLTSEQLEAIRENFEVSLKSIPAVPHMLLGELHEQMGISMKHCGIMRGRRNSIQAIKRQVIG